MPSVHSLKWWMTASMLLASSSRGGGMTLRSDVWTAPLGNTSSAWRQVMTLSRSAGLDAEVGRSGGVKFVREIGGLLAGWDGAIGSEHVFGGAELVVAEAGD